MMKKRRHRSRSARSKRPPRSSSPPPLIHHRTTSLRHSHPLAQPRPQPHQRVLILRVDRFNDSVHREFLPNRQRVSVASKRRLFVRRLVRHTPEHRRQRRLHRRRDLLRAANDLAGHPGERRDFHAVALGARALSQLVKERDRRVRSFVRRFVRHIPDRLVRDVRRHVAQLHEGRRQKLPAQAVVVRGEHHATPRRVREVL
mmetsp:Transcript_9987/g.40376  ORF Transcript_9987/g.40376 Transcript_9987/m.40376 type:complete len:201 (-) Transcript_9987:1199-1801(-)